MRDHNPFFSSSWGNSFFFYLKFLWKIKGIEGGIKTFFAYRRGEQKGKGVSQTS
jgi:hypothetical protein